jgi:fatty-acid peroxygenase
MSSIPRDPSPDSTLALLSEGYSFIRNRCRRFGSDVFEARLMLTRAVCMMGAEAAEQFYHPGRFTRRYAMPRFSLSLIQDFGSVMVMDGEDHHRRKEMFLSIMRPEVLGSLSALTAAHWRARARRWQDMDEVNFFHEAHIPLCGAICEWAGLTLSEDQVEKHAREFEAMVEGTGSVGPRNWRGHLMRSRTERWMRNVVRQIRSGALRVPEGSAADIVTSHRDGKGDLLDVRVAAVELINVLRPTVANARFAVFITMALHDHPEWRERLQASDEDLEVFVQEVRRFYPFIPFIGGRVLEPFDWRGRGFAKDDWVLIDLHGTNRDPRTWGDADAFRPERFREQAITPYNFIPHGGGEHSKTHRCPGEWISIEQMKTITRLLTREMRYLVPDQDLSIDLARMPAVPRSRFMMQKVNGPQ